MKSLFLLLAVILSGPNPLAAQNDPETFSEAEVYQALSWGMTESEARKLAKYMSDDPTVTATLPTFRELGPVTSMYSENMLLLLSLVSDETNRKVEQRLIQARLGKELDPHERAQWEKRRAEFRSQLIKAGKLRER
jgi:hypothetical protein